jgi:hypothetical protein
VNRKRHHTYIRDRRRALRHSPRYHHYHRQELARQYHPYYHFDQYMAHTWGPSWRTRFRYSPTWRFGPLVSVRYFSTYFTRRFDGPYTLTAEGDHMYVNPFEANVAGYYYDTSWNRWIVIDSIGRQFYFDTFEDGVQELPPTIVVSGWYVSDGTYIFF